MFIKAKYKIWFTILAVCVICSVLMRVIPQIKANKEEKKKNEVSYTIQMDTKDQALNIVTDKSEEHAGYEKMEGGLYTTFTLFANKYLYKGYDDNWLNKSNEHDTDKYSKDIRLLLEAIEHGKSWKDIGINESSIIENLNERAKLYIPNQYHYSYKYLRLYIAMALNDYQPIDSSNQEDLLKRADGIISKLDECEVLEVMKDSNMDGIILAPESTITECSQKFTGSSLGVISPGKSLRIEYDVYVKPDKTERFKDLSKEYKFLNLFGLRSINGNDLSSSQNLFRRCFDVTDTIRLDDIVGSTEILNSAIFMPEDIKPIETETQAESVNESSVSEDMRTNETSTDEVEENEDLEEQLESEKGSVNLGDIIFWAVVIVLVIMFVIYLIAVILY